MNHKQSIFSHKLYLTDGGLETSLIYNQGISLKEFAAFDLLRSDAGKSELKKYYEPYLQLAVRSDLPFIFETPTWRANTDWGFKLGYTHEELFAINQLSVKFIQYLGTTYEKMLPQIIYSGNIGPRGDGYKPGSMMLPREATAYHQEQIKAFALADADIVTALTINYSNEAIGIINAARVFHLPVVISFTVETDGRLPSNETLQKVIEDTDKETDAYASHFMINCAHPAHILPALKTDGEWKKRIRGIRANASTKSHSELDESTTLDAGDKHLLADGYQQLFKLLPAIKIVGGCCGTDVTHIEKICKTI